MPYLWVRTKHSRLVKMSPTLAKIARYSDEPITAPKLSSGKVSVRVCWVPYRAQELLDMVVSWFRSKQWPDELLQQGRLRRVYGAVQFFGPTSLDVIRYLEEGWLGAALDASRVEGPEESAP